MLETLTAPNVDQPSLAHHPIWEVLGAISDPEVPVISILDLGIVREVLIEETTKSVEVHITPTYSGCPAMDVISVMIKMALLEYGFSEVKVKLLWAPAWTTDWMSESGKLKLKAYGIAPPEGKARQAALLGQNSAIACPLCHSKHTELLSLFGSTACKSLHRCLDCQEPFDYFKCH